MATSNEDQNVAAGRDTYQFEIAVPVISYYDSELADEMDQDQAHDMAFELAKDTEGYIDDLYEEAEELIKEARIEDIIVGSMLKEASIEFTDFDSSNINHAGAYFVVTINGDSARVAVFAMAMDLLAI